jgi:anti-sigma-K factor RskA
MSAVHEDVSALAPAFVLGALDAEERRTFEAHLAECPLCQAEVRSLMPIVDVLARAVPQVAPSLALRRRVVDAVAAQAAVVGTTAARQDAVATSRRAGMRPSAIFTWLPLAALLALSIGLGAYVTTLRARISDLEVRLDEAAAQLAAATTATTEVRRVAFQAQSIGSVLAAPDLVRIDLAGQTPAPQASARALWSRTRGMVFTFSNLPKLPDGRVYQVWVVTADAPISAGLLALDDAGRGVGVFETPPDVAPIAVAVTDEPAGGVPQPSGSFQLLGKPIAG